jgi:putative ABC transport system permease protein
MTARWLTTWRLAWRLVRKAPARSVLVAALVALPVVAGTFVAVTIRTGELSPEQAAQRTMGNADAVAVVTTSPTLDPSLSVIGFAGGYASEQGMATSGEGLERDSGAVDLPALLPDGARATRVGWQRYVPVTAGARTAEVPATLVDLRDPITHGIYDVTDGRAPSGVAEVAVTTHLAKRLALHVGATVDVAGQQRTVAAIVRDPMSLSADQVVGPAAAFGGVTRFPGATAAQYLTWLIEFPNGHAPNLHRDLAADGVVYETRAQWEHPGSLISRSVHANSQAKAILGSVIGFGLIEIVLLAGTAFAVGVRRQIRELGLVRAIGGDERDVRRVILAQGALLGIAGACVGVALGFVLEILLEPTLERFADKAFGPLEARAVEVLGVALVGVVAAVLAAVVPARTSARLSVLDMLRTRFRVDLGAARPPRWVWAALAVGPLIVIGAALGWHHSSGNTSGSVGLNRFAIGYAGSRSHDGRWTALMSVGAAVVLAGLVRSCPALLTRLGQRANALPLTLRIAIRDAARHRHRTAPAVAAVATVVAGAVLVLFVVSSNDVKDRRDYSPYQPVGTVSVALGGPKAAYGDIAAVTQRVAHRLGATSGDVVSRAVLADERRNDRVTEHAPGCPITGDNTCDAGPIGVADGRLIATLAGHPVPAATAALARGGAVVLDRAEAPAGVASADEIRIRHGQIETHQVRLAATVVPVPDRGHLPTMYVSPQTAADKHWLTVPVEGLIRPAHLPSTDAADKINRSLGRHAGLQVERGYQGTPGVILLALFGGSALAVLVGISIAVALAVAEGRADNATLAAVGASPARRRLLAMGQAASVGVLGASLGLALGTLVGIALLQGSTSYPFSLPLRWLALVVVTAPVLAIAVAGVATRGRMSMTRRIA